MLITVTPDEHMYTLFFFQFPHLKNEKEKELKTPNYELNVASNQGYCHSDTSRMPPKH